MKAPLTKAYFEKNVAPLISNKGERNNLFGHVKGLEILEKPLLADPANAKKSVLLKYCLNNVQTCSLKLKNMDKPLKDEVVKICKAIKKYRAEHNNKIVGMIKASTIGSVPGGMKNFFKACEKDYALESYNYLKEVQKVKKDGTALVSMHKKYINDINVSGSDKKKYDKLAKAVNEAQAALKKKENKVNPKLRVACLEHYDECVDELYKMTWKVREVLLALLNDVIQRMSKEITI
ncbi:MAG: hypothetical protein COA78_26210 [Blastopirellula sp.]|nr:MAG: hypothetical protein COA78_26210 [Blastopirellula sp.]